RGRTIGVPTINFDLDALAGWAIPADGVYAGHATLSDGATRPAAISIGVKPTFRGGTRVVEAHLIGFAGDLYGQVVTLAFTRWLRDQRPFPSLDSLKAQLARDIAQAGRWSELSTPAWSGIAAAMNSSPGNP
ncbi:MAG: riboflavin kinase, partial [Planctomycetota bacterium]|nr:riboflavin kinase [Planctomycetota bacterium]